MPLLWKTLKKPWIEWLRCYLKPDSVVSRLEARLGLYPAGMAVSLLLMMAAALYFPFSFKTKYLGNLYKALSLSPLGFEKSHEIQYRILTPFLANTVGLKGDLYIWFPLLMGLFFLTAIYISFRKNHYTPLESTGMSALMAFSIPILFGFYFQGYTDTTSYLLLFLCIIFIKRPVLWTIFYSLALLNHESNLFAAPWLLFMADDCKIIPTRRSLALLLISLLPMLLFRFYASQFVQAKYSFSFYLRSKVILANLNRNSRYFHLGVFEAFRLFWFFPLMGLFVFYRTKQWGKFSLIGLVISCALAQMIFAYDISRLTGLAFPAILISADEIRKSWGSDRFVKLLWIIIFLNFLVPQYFVIGGLII